MRSICILLMAFVGFGGQLPSLSAEPEFEISYYRSRAGGHTLWEINKPVPTGVTTNTAIVRSIRGTASYSFNGDSWLPLKAGTRLSAGYSIKTSESAIVDVFLGNNGPVLRLTSDTLVRIETLLLGVADRQFTQTV